MERTYGHEKEHSIPDACPGALYRSDAAAGIDSDAEWRDPAQWGQVGNDNRKADYVDRTSGLPIMNQTTPVKIMDGVVAVDVGDNCAGALKADGSL